MRNNFRYIGAFIVMLFMLSWSSCSATRETEVEDELSAFRTWVSRETSQLASRTEEDWQRAKQDFKVRTNELDQKQDHFSAELKEEYKQLKQEFNNADESYANARSEARLAEMEQKLLGNWTDLSLVNETNVRAAYITFMENVRAHKTNWSNQDWDMAKMVLQKLNDRKSEITADIDTDSEVKIKALQMEFHTLETAADISGN